MNRPTKKRFSLDLPLVIYHLVKKSAEFRNINITRWIIQAIMMRLRSEKEYE